jgi:nucleoside-diphosphate-sugar epimerase
MKILINGSTGSLGTEITENFSYKHDVLGSRADVASAPQVLDEMKAFKPDVVIHLAALVGTKNCEEVPRLAVETNALGTINVVNAAREVGAKLVYFSTTAIYKPGVVPIMEDSEKEPATVYPLTKWWGEQLARRYTAKRDLLVFRPCFGFGGRGDRTSMLAALVRSSYTGNYVSLLIDMTKQKDYTDVRNFVHALDLMIQRDAFGEDFNVSGGEPIPYGEIIEKLIARGLRPRYKNFPELDYGGDHVVLYNKARSLVGYEPVVSFDKGLDDLIGQIDGGMR